MSDSATFFGDSTLTELEGRLLEIYDGLKEILKRDDCPPCVLFSVKQSLAALYPAVNDLGLAYEYLFDYGV
ncbi:MAG: hypothetical protein M1343_13350 [Chloroflexi bacterium]|nr:hypothetical protein [Chloroflexota bacterium]MDA8188826.1 hypothetical protein [Dehalococcoidales bacterium]